MDRLSKLEPDFRAIVEDIKKLTEDATGLEWYVVSGLRSFTEQADLYAQGRTKKGSKVTNATPGSSAHNYALAADLAPLVKGTHTSIWWSAPENIWNTYGAIVEQSGMTWGGHFKSIKDNPHCEHPRWHEMRAKWRSGEWLPKE